MEINCDSLFTKTISKSNKPLVGLEYIIEFDDSDNILRPFYCALCDTYCNEDELIFNLTSHEHRIKFLEQNIPSVMKILDANKSFNTISTFRDNILHKISNRLQIHLIIPKIKKFSLNDFKSSKSSIIKSIKSSITKIDSLISPLELLNDLNLNDINFPTQTCCIFEIPNSNLKSRLKTFYESSKLSELKIHEIYKEFRKNPASHPRYTSEWRNFYCRQHPNIKNIDWMSFFIHRLEEFHYEEINLKNGQILEELNLTQDIIRRDQNDMMNKIIGKSKTRNRTLNDDNYIESCIRDPKIPRKLRKPCCIIDELHSMTNCEILDPARYKYDAPGTVFSVCRQILAFPEVIKIFEQSVWKIYIKAAELEKKKYFSSEELLKDDENLMLFVTIKDVLRNAIDQKLIEESAVKCAQRTIQQINAMTFEAEYRTKNILDDVRSFRNWKRKLSDDEEEVGKIRKIC